MPSLTDWLFSAFTQSLQSAETKVWKSSENQECLAEKIIKSSHFFKNNAENLEEKRIIHTFATA